MVWVVVNHSLREGVVLLALKDAVVHPLQKGPLLDPTSLDCFHPASNLPFLEKVVEMIVSWQMQKILDEANYLDLFSQGSGQVLGLKWQQCDHPCSF